MKYYNQAQEGAREDYDMWAELTTYQGKMTERLWPMALDTFGKRLRVLRIDKDMSQIELRDKMATIRVTIGETYISELERTAKMPSLEVAAGMARVLDVSLDYLGLVIDDAVSWRRTPTPDYFSPEADEMARLVDTMSPAQRTAIISVAHSMVSPTQQQRDHAEARDIMQSIEDQFGEDVRREVEQIVRGKRAPLDSAA